MTINTTEPAVRPAPEPAAINSGSADVVLACSGVAKSYREGSRSVQVLRDINFSVRKGERVAIIGSSGSGKSTLLNLLGGLDNPSEGSVQVASGDLGPMSESMRARWRNRHLGFVYQFHHLLAEFTAVENVAMPLLISGCKKAEAMRLAAELLDKVGLAERFEHKPAMLSGGERQRVAIARALVADPTCVLMDEPTGNLDPETAARVLALILQLNRDLSSSFVIVTHDQQVAAQMDRVLRLADGKLYQLPVADRQHSLEAGCS